MRSTPPPTTETTAIIARNSTGIESPKRSRASPKKARETRKKLDCDLYPDLHRVPYPGGPSDYLSQSSHYCAEQYRK